MAASPPRGRLLRKVLGATLLPAVLVLVVFGVLAHEVARQSLEEELGKRLATAAAGAAQLIVPDQIVAIGTGDESSHTYANLRRRLEQAKVEFGVRRVALVARDLTGRGDTDGRVPLGATAHELGADVVELEQAAAGQPTSSPLFWGRDRLPYKRGYARVASAGGGSAVGFVVVEGSADYFTSLAAFRRWLAAGAGIGVLLIVLFAISVARRITGRLARLGAAAERIGRGELAVAVAADDADELGYLAARFDDMRAALRARDERMQMMLAGIAHEVRNPLGGLELYAGLLREQLGGQPDRLDEVARIEREIGYLKTVVSDFLDYARRTQPERADVPVRALLDEVAEVCGPPVKVDAPADLAARCDRGQLRRALINLARNAIAAAGRSGNVVLAARAGANGVAGRVEWEVRDSGPGVSDELRDKIFAPFFTTREKGTGLGLALTQDIVRDHGGDVAVDRAPEGGARFRFTT